MELVDKKRAIIKIEQQSRWHSRPPFYYETIIRKLTKTKSKSIVGTEKRKQN